MFLSNVNKSNQLLRPIFNYQIRHNSILSSNEEIKSKYYPSDVTIVEVGPRDGLQNEK